MKTEPRPRPCRPVHDTGKLLLSLSVSLLLLLVLLLLTGCAEMPVTLSVEGQHGSYSYSAKRGIKIEVHASK